MTSRRKNKAQAAPLTRNRFASALRVAPRGVASAAGQSVSNIHPGLLKNVDLHPGLVLLIGVAIIALVCVIYLGQVTAVINANYTLEALKTEQSDLLREQQDLQLQIGRAQSLPNIEKIARDKLRMVPVDNNYTYLPVPSGPITAMPPLPTPALPGDGAGSTP